MRNIYIYINIVETRQCLASTTLIDNHANKSIIKREFIILPIPYEDGLKICVHNNLLRDCCYANNFKVKYSAHQYCLAETITGLTHAAYQPRRLRGAFTTEVERYLILRLASHLDAFSAYPFQTWLPSHYPWQDNWNTRGLYLPVLSY